MDTFEIRNKKAVYNGIEYDFNELPKNIVFDGAINISFEELSKLPNMSSWVILDNFGCCYNNLTSLKGCPKKVCGNFRCGGNNLTSLKYCPEEVGGGFWCYRNELTSLLSCPKRVGDYFDCSYNKIETIDAWPEYIGGDINIDHCLIKFIKEGVMPLRYLINFYKENIHNSKELLIKEFGVSAEEELNAYLIMMGKI